MNTTSILLNLVAIISSVLGACSYIELSESDLTIKAATARNFTVTARNVQCYTSVLKFSVEHPDIVEVLPGYMIVEQNGTYTATLKAHIAGKSDVTAQFYCLETSSETFMKVSVFRNSGIELLSHVTGWLYLSMWSFANAPQIWLNYKRKSVAGLSMDFVVLNALGHAYYTVFNTALYYNPTIKRQYSRRFPKSAKPVALNDVVYAIIIAIASFVILMQAYVYDKGGQNVSQLAKIFLLFCFCTMGITVAFIHHNLLEWLDFIYVCSYLKLMITAKYIPQVVTNCRRRSTEGWSMGGVLLDLLGGLLSIIQMILVAYNYNDWPLFFENCTKFGLGLLSISFDIIFIVQHYILFSTNKVRCTETSNTLMLTPK